MAKSKDKKQVDLASARDPWIKGATGLKIMAVLSIGLGIFTGVNVFKVLGLGQAVLWGVGSAVGLWILFGGLYVFNRFLSGR